MTILKLTFDEFCPIIGAHSEMSSSFQIRRKPDNIPADSPGPVRAKYHGYIKMKNEGNPFKSCSAAGGKERREMGRLVLFAVLLSAAVTD